uniref:Dystroglycan-type cadherin-like domain-containing protein n=1 Tax=Acrobeloides nanus TaxID=290746 RepID=A0A914CFJ9_9BILA
MKNLLFLLLYGVLSSQYGFLSSQQAKSSQINVAKGQFMIHMLHSAYLFPHTVDVKWTATAQGKPVLPVWLHLFPSKYKAIAYLVGTPVTPMNQITVHIIAKRLDNYQTAEQFLTIVMTDDVRFNTSTQQLTEIHIKNIEAEEFLNRRGGKVERLEKSIRETFRGKDINPYIFNILSDKKFHPNVHNLVIGLRSNAQYCNKSSIIPLNKHFVPEFQVDWCDFNVKNMTLIKSLANLDKKQHDSTIIKASHYVGNASELRAKKFLEEHQTGTYTSPSHFWESVLIFPLLAAFCILLILCLSLIFFGRREGQHWRDYKTPKDQLQKFLDVRESQRQLRELSVQRQMLHMASDRKSTTPLGIHAFLKPRSSTDAMQTPRSLGHAERTPQRQPLRGRSYTSLGGEGMESTSMIAPRASVGKQTVAEAAKATGSSLHLYRNPHEDEDQYSDDSHQQEEPRQT